MSNSVYQYFGADFTRIADAHNVELQIIRRAKFKCLRLDERVLVKREQYMWMLDPLQGLTRLMSDTV